MSLVVVTREPPLNDDLIRALRAVATVREVPATETHWRTPSQVRDDLRSVTTEIGTLIVTSARSAESAPLVLAHSHSHPRVIAVGDVTKVALESFGVTVDDVATGGTAASIATGTLDLDVVSLGSADPRPELATELRSRGIDLTHVVAYETVPRALSDAERDHVAHATYVVIGAPSAWRVIGPHVRSDATVLVPGETTASVVRAEHGNVVIAGMTNGVVDEIRRREDAARRAN